MVLMNHFAFWRARSSQSRFISVVKSCNVRCFSVEFIMRVHLDRGGWLIVALLNIMVLGISRWQGDWALEANPQNRARREFDVVAFGHQHAAERARARRPRKAADAAARCYDNQPADAAKARARARIARCASAGMSAADFAFIILRF